MYTSHYSNWLLLVKLMNAWNDVPEKNAQEINFNKYNHQLKTETEPLFSGQRLKQTNQKPTQGSDNQNLNVS